MNKSETALRWFWHQLLTLFSRPSMYLYTMLRRYYKCQANSYQHSHRYKSSALYKKKRAIYTV